MNGDEHRHRRRILRYIQDNADRCRALIVVALRRRRFLDISFSPAEAVQAAYADMWIHFRDETLTEAESVATPEQAVRRCIDNWISRSYARGKRRIMIPMDCAQTGKNIIHIFAPEEPGPLFREFAAYIRSAEPTLEKYVRAVLYENRLKPKELAESFDIPVRSADDILRRIRGHLSTFLGYRPSRRSRKRDQ